MTLTLKPQWSEHTLYKGVPIFKRVARTGTSQGQWMAANTYCHSLRSAKEQIDQCERVGIISQYLKP